MILKYVTYILFPITLHVLMTNTGLSSTSTPSTETASAPATPPASPTPSTDKKAEEIKTAEKAQIASQTLDSFLQNGQTSIPTINPSAVPTATSSNSSGTNPSREFSSNTSNSPNATLTNGVSGSSNYTAGSSNYIPGSSNYTAGSSNYIPGSSNYAAGGSNYLPSSPHSYGSGFSNIGMNGNNNTGSGSYQTGNNAYSNYTTGSSNTNYSQNHQPTTAPLNYNESITGSSVSGQNTTSTNQTGYQSAQILTNIVAEEITSYRSATERLAKDTERTAKLAKESAAKAVAEATDVIVATLANQPTVSEMGRRALSTLSKAAQTADLESKDAEADPLATPAQKLATQKLAAQLAANYQALYQAQSLQENTFNAIQTASQLAERARDFVKPMILAADAAIKANDMAQAALAAAKNADRNAALPMFDLKTPESMLNAVNDCRKRTKEECQHRDTHCIWFNEIVGCTFKCNSVSNQTICSTISKGKLCIWGDNQGKPFCFHK